MNTSFKISSFLLLSLALIITAQSSKHKEVIDDLPVNQSKFNQQTSVAYTYSDEHFFMKQVNVTNNQMNIMGDAANEPSIAFNYQDPTRIAIGWRQFDNISSNFRQAGLGATADGGLTWYSIGPLEQGVFRSDPVLDSDAQGNFYYNSLTVRDGNDFVCTVFKSTDSGVNWNEGVDAQGGDKQWMIIDKTSNPSSGFIYAYWNASFSHCPDKSFTRSIDGGLSFEECVAIPGDPFWGTLAVDKNSDLYLTGYSENNFVVVKSTNAKYADSTVSFHDPVKVDMDGDLPSFGGPNPAGITGQIYIATDTSNGQNSGNIYLLATVENNTSGDPADIRVAASTDGGETWLPSVRVNDDESTTNWQWFGDMSVAPDGRIDVVWLDTRNSLNGYDSELFYSFSYDGGQTWNENIRLSESFDPQIGWPQQNKMGDYFDMVSDERGVHLAWAATFNGEQDVYYGRIFADVINSVEDKNQIPMSFSIDQNFPNPFNPTTKIKYNVPSSSFIKISVYNTLGEKISELVSEQKPSGSYEVEFTGDEFTSGVYFYTMEVDGKFADSKKMLLVK